MEVARLVTTDYETEIARLLKDAARVSNNILSLCDRYLCVAENEDDDIKRIQNKVKDIARVSSMLRFLRPGRSSIGHMLILLNRVSLSQCLQELQDIEVKIAPGMVQYAPYQVNFSKWPFTSSQVDRIVSLLELYERSFTKALKTELRDATSNEADVPGTAGVLSDSHDTLNKAKDGPHTWLLQSDEYKKWSNEHRGGMLWIRGKPDQGKSMLKEMMMQSSDNQEEQMVLPSSILQQDHNLVLEHENSMILRYDLNDDSRSFQDSTYGTISKADSVHAAVGLPGVREEILDILIKDTSLQQSGKDAVEVMSAEAFVKLFKRLLRRFSQELRQEAEQKNQRAAAYAFSYYAIYAASSACDYWRGMEGPGWADMLAQLPEKRIELDSTLQRIAPRMVREDEADDDDGTNEEWEDGDPDELQHLVHLKRLENFITSSIAFQNLRRNVQDLSTQSDDDADQMTSQCRFVFEQSPLKAVQDICKKTIEHLAGTRLSWWPLSEPEDVIKANFTRVYSQPLTNSSYCQRSFYDDIPTSLAEKLFPGIVAARTVAPKVRWEKLRHEAVFLEGTTLMRLLRNRTRKVVLSDKYESVVAQHKDTKDASDSNEQATSSSSKGKGKQPMVDAGVTGTGSGSTSSAPKNDHNKGPKGDQSGKPPVDGGSSDQLDDKKSVLFLSIDIEKNDSRACSVDVGMNDLTTMASLRQSYNALRGSFLWSRKCAVGIRFYRFKSFLYKPERRHHIQLHRDRERYPPQDDGDYDWQLGTEWQEGDPYPNGEAWYFFSHPDDCGSSTTLREMLPKRKKDEPKSGKTVYGMYIEQRHSVWQIFIPVVIVLMLTLGGTLWFIRVWLKDHPDDLQGATVPVFLAWTVVQSILSLLVALVVFRWSL